MEDLKSSRESVMGNSKQRIVIHSNYIFVERPPNYEVVASELPAMLEEISESCQNSGCQKVLITGPKTKVRLATFDIYDLGKHIAKLGLQIAVVESHDASVEEVNLLENVVENRGAPIQFFEDEQLARDWLGIE